MTVRLTVRHQAAYPVEAQRHTRRNSDGGLWAITGMAIAHAQAEREPLTPHAETQADLREIIRPICAMAIGRTWGHWTGPQAALLLIGARQRDRRGSLMEPGGGRA